MNIHEVFTQPMIQTSGDRLAKDVLHFIQIHDDDDRDRDDRFVFSSELRWETSINSVFVV